MYIYIYIYREREINERDDRAAVLAVDWLEDVLARVRSKVHDNDDNNDNNMNTRT